MFPVGSCVVTRKSHLHGGERGEVVKVTDGIHTIKIAAKNGPGFWHTASAGDYIKLDL